MYLEEEQIMEDKMRLQCLEGDLLVDSYRIQQELEHEESIQRNRSRLYNDSASTIQQAWRRKEYDKHGSSSHSGKTSIDIPPAEYSCPPDEFPDPYTYYVNNRAKHKLEYPKGGNFDDTLLDETDTDIDPYGRYNDLSHDDSLEDCCDGKNHLSDKTSNRLSNSSSFPGEFMLDNEFDTQEYRTYLDVSASSLPSPTTDWDTIESVLTAESGFHSPDRDSDSEDVHELSSRLSTGLNVQMTFVDADSDNESNPDVEVYDVYDGNIETLDYMERKNTSGSTGSLGETSDRNIDSRDSGYVPGDLCELNIERVTDLKSKRGPDSLEPVEESRRVLTSLKIHEEHEKKRREVEEQRKKEDARSMIHLKNIEELRMMKAMLEEKIVDINLELVQELMTRDELHSKHEALLMDADDLAKLAQEQQNAANNTTPTNSKKRQSFLKR